uniref:NADH-ubiquinone oxidoreductase chain 2 n=1 Tax=Cephalothrix simula TaxID=187810 RepID=C5HYJ5_9BILA|nr:NADH dehydrogenase subunit 2 [Cephalothrix simula]ACL27427.1 NADH dehydrogenase subunit 2 [Cephalothrix simula]
MLLGFPFKLVFIFVLFFGSFLSLSSSHWMGMWMGFELNLMSFIPLLMSISSVSEVESGVKYFLIQSLGSCMFLLGGFWLYSLGFNLMDFYINWFFSMIFLSGLLLKMGCFPFHLWVPSVMSSLSWFGCMLLATWQKLAPLFIFFWFFFDSWMYFVCFFAIMSSLVGGFGGISQVQIRVLMAYSSINHLGWMIAISIYSFFGLFSYYIVYFIISLYIFFLFFIMDYGRLSQSLFLLKNKFFSYFILFSLLSLAGLPPFTGFLTKWIVFQELMMNGSFFFLSFLLLGSFFSLYFYLNLFFILYLSTSIFSFFNFEMIIYKYFVILGFIFVIMGFGVFEIFFTMFM